MFKKIVQHLKTIERQLARMDKNAAFAFALACTERQWPPFQRAMATVSWMVASEEVLRDTLSFAWHCTQHDSPFWVTESIISFRQSLIESGAGESKEEEAEGLLIAIAYTIANSIVALFRSIETKNTDDLNLISSRNFDLIELLLNEHGLLLDDITDQSGIDPPEIAKLREQIEEEMQQQERDLGALEKDSSVNGIEKVRRISSGKSVFGQNWFS